MPAPKGILMSYRPLEPTGDDLRKLLDQVVDYLVEVVDRLPDRPVLDDDGVGELLVDPALRSRPPEDGTPLPDLLGRIDRAANKGITAASPGLMAYIPGSGLISSAVADLIAGVLNRYTGQAGPAPGLVAMEQDVLRWIADLFDLPATAAGTLTPGASAATLSAVATARTAMLPPDFLRGTAYVTAHTHLSFAKAMRLAGFPPKATRVVPTDDRHRMDVGALRAMVADDRAAGLQPFCVVGTAGTTNTGVIDPLAELAEVAGAERLWFHVDAAYGGFFQLTDRGRARMTGIERGDSIVLDPHKGLFVPFGSGCLLVRDGALLRAAHSGEPAAYLRDLDGAGLPDYSDYSIDLTRGFRGLRLWLPLHLHGVAAFRAALDEKLDLAEWLYAELSAIDGVEVLGRPSLSTVTMRLADDEATGELLRRISAEGRVLPSSTTIDGRTVIRFCVLNHRTDATRVAEAADAVRRGSGRD